MTIKASNNISDLIGEGIEILTDNEGNPLAQFYDGNFMTEWPSGNTEDTRVL